MKNTSFKYGFSNLSLRISVSFFFVALFLCLSSLLMTATRPLPTLQTDQPNEIGHIILIPHSQPNGSVNYSENLSIKPIAIGQLILKYPTEINLRDSGTVSLSISSIDFLSKINPLPKSTQYPGSYDKLFEITDMIDIFPIMNADLVGTGFDISPNEQKTKPILNDKSTEWTWVITPKTEGTQSLILQISIPVLINGNKDTISSPIKDIPLKIQVKKIFWNVIGDFSPFLEAVLTGGLAILGIYFGSKWSKKKK